MISNTQMTIEELREQVRALLDQATGVAPDFLDDEDADDCIVRWFNIDGPGEEVTFFTNDPAVEQAMKLLWDNSNFVGCPGGVNPVKP